MSDVMRDTQYERAMPAQRAAVDSKAGALSLALQRAAKRAIDFMVAAAGLVLLSPFLVLVAVAVRLESKGPVLFRQTRLGKDAQPFTFYKFRTMVDGNDPAIHRRYVENLIAKPSEELKGDTGSFKIENDPRLTRLGGLLRRTSVDELPQLFNVLTGEMSLVGPRPPLAYEVELYSARALRRLECKPGITGLWQVSGRCMTTFDEMVELDVEYIETWSLALDLRILARTPRAVLGGKGAW
jgi:lipopolysaccharide/colanic/teichoic acid biosynthesis glycosyltransferase